MTALFEIPGMNIYMQIAVTIISSSSYLFSTHNRERKGTVLELIAIYTIGLSGWFKIMSGLFGHFLYADQVVANIGWPLQSGFQMELGFASTGIGLVGFLGFWNHSYWLPFIIMKFIFGWGARYTQFLQMIRHGNFSPSNIGLIVYLDFLFPVFMIALCLLTRKKPVSVHFLSKIVRRVCRSLLSTNSAILSWI